MARQGLVGRATRRRFRCLTRPDKAARPAPDLVKRDFTAPAINVKWCGDLTEVPTDEGKLYLGPRRGPGVAADPRLRPVRASRRRRSPSLRCRWPPPCGAATSPG